MGTIVAQLVKSPDVFGGLLASEEPDVLASNPHDHRVGVVLVVPVVDQVGRLVREVAPFLRQGEAAAFEDGSERVLVEAALQPPPR